jgi:hypothetical protein
MVRLSGTSLHEGCVEISWRMQAAVAALEYE